MPKPPTTPKSERETRLAQALRANLRRRKAQARRGRCRGRTARRWRRPAGHRHGGPGRADLPRRGQRPAQGRHVPANHLPGHAKVARPRPLR
ncbi:hypothetical protein ACFQU2_39145 [Siccirubricoccus deserti]